MGADHRAVRRPGGDAVSPEPPPASPRQEGEYLEQAAEDPSRVLWAITLRDTRAVIGATVLEKIDWRNRDAESGLMIGDKAHWRRGYASEAMRLRTSMPSTS